MRQNLYPNATSLTRVLDGSNTAARHQSSRSVSVSVVDLVQDYRSSLTRWLRIWSSVQEQFLLWTFWNLFSDCWVIIAHSLVPRPLPPEERLIHTVCTCLPLYFSPNFVHLYCPYVEDYTNQQYRASFQIEYYLSDVVVSFLQNVHWSTKQQINLPKQLIGSCLYTACSGSVLNMIGLYNRNNETLTSSELPWVCAQTVCTRPLLGGALLGAGLSGSLLRTNQMGWREGPLCGKIVSRVGMCPPNFCLQIFIAFWWYLALLAMLFSDVEWYCAVWMW